MWDAEAQSSEPTAVLAGFDLSGTTASGFASTATSTSAPGLSFTSLPLASSKRFSMRISLYSSSAPSTAISAFSGTSLWSGLIIFCPLPGFTVFAFLVIQTRLPCYVLPGVSLKYLRQAILTFLQAPLVGFPAPRLLPRSARARKQTPASESAVYLSADAIPPVYSHSRIEKPHVPYRPALVAPASVPGRRVPTRNEPVSQKERIEVRCSIESYWENTDERERSFSMLC